MKIYITIYEEKNGTEVKKSPSLTPETIDDAIIFLEANRV